MLPSIHIHTPGRICLFGDHQDYLGLPVIACAIDKGITLIATPNNVNHINIQLPNVQTQRTILLDEPLQTNSNRDYFVSALRVVANHGCHPTGGYVVEIKGDIPINAGVSSSSALVVSWIHFLLKAYGCNQEITPTLIGELAYQAEVVQFDEPGGKMDQFTCSLGGMVFLEMGSQFSCTPLETSLPGIVLGNSGVEKKTLSVLSQARTRAEEAIAIVKKNHLDFVLKDVKVTDVKRYSEGLSEELQAFFVAAISNHLITQKALIELKKPSVDIKYVGQLMSQHHEILKDILSITVPRIDKMIEAALAAGAYGAKIVGSGGGGCIIALAPNSKREVICEAIRSAGAIEAYPIQVATGTQQL